MQKNNSASSLIVECESGRERNERLLVPDPPSATIVDFEDTAADADEEEYREVICRPKGARADDGRTPKRLFVYVIFILFISKYVPGLCDTVQ